MAKNVGGNNFLWWSTYFSNIVIGLVGLGLIVISVILFVQADKIFTLGFAITTVGIIAILTSCGIILSSRYSSTMICFMYFLQGILLALFAALSIYIAVDYEGLINIITEKTQTSKEEKENIEKFVRANLNICSIACYIILAVLVR
jgi:hypothetical protein